MKGKLMIVFQYVTLWLMGLAELRNYTETLMVMESYYT